jgi:hypothetical protein
MNQLGLIKPVDGFCSGIVVAVAAAADRRFDPSNAALPPSLISTARAFYTGF